MFIKKIFWSLPIVILYLFYKFSKLFFKPIVLSFIFEDYDNNFNISKSIKLNIVKKLLNAFSNIKSATSLESNIILLIFGFKLPNKNTNYIVECGSYEGATSITLSILAEYTDRKLIIYDSFKGLPKTNHKEALYPHLNLKGKYSEGMFSASRVTLETNLKKYGFFDRCIIREGFFESTLTNHHEIIDFLFLDVDLIDSTKNCILNLWPKVINNGFIFTDDSCDMNLVKLWFDDLWWSKNLGIQSPGYIGSGCGLPIKGYYSSLGYTIKNYSTNNFKQAQWLDQK